MAKPSKQMQGCDCSKSKLGFSCKASCKARGLAKRTGGKLKGKKVKSSKYGGKGNKYG